MFILITCKYHKLFIYCKGDRPLDCFRFELIVNKAAVKILYVLILRDVFFLLDINPGMELLACSLCVCSAWVDALKQFSKIYTCTGRIWELQLLHMLQTHTIIFISLTFKHWLFRLMYSSGITVHFPKNAKGFLLLLLLFVFSCFIDQMNFLFWKILVEFSTHISIGVFIIFLIEF